MQQALVDHILSTGDSITDASNAVGYSDRSTASKTLGLPHVQQYMLQQTAAMLGQGAMWAASKMMRLSQTAKSEYVQLEASKDILDRSGFKPPDRQQVQIDQQVTVHIDLG